MEGNGQAETLFPEKDLFRIGEVSRLTSTKPFVLRYWESEFPMLQPVKSPKGHRMYRREDVETVLRIKRLLYDEGFTIIGARRFLREQGDTNGDALLAEKPDREVFVNLERKMLLELHDTLRAFLTLLERE
jgi:DNA-binding transcriptional MerR regulator